MRKNSGTPDCQYLGGRKTKTTNKKIMDNVFLLLYNIKI